jgi:hypothetical protein
VRPVIGRWQGALSCHLVCERRCVVINSVAKIRKWNKDPFEKSIIPSQKAITGA